MELMADKSVLKPAQRREGPGRSAFASLAIWRTKVADDLESVPSSDGFKLRLLADQTKELEMAVLGCLKDALFELEESAGFGLLPPDFVDGQRSVLLSQAAQELLNDKNLILELARDAGLLEQYLEEVRRVGAHTLADYDTLGALRLGLMAWRANLHQEMATGGGSDAQATLTAGWGAAAALVRRCVHGSVRFWAAQQAGGAPGPVEAGAAIAAAEGRARQMLTEIAESHHLGTAAADAAVAAAAEAEGEGAGEEGGAESGLGASEGVEGEGGGGEGEGGADVDVEKVPAVREKYRVEEDPAETSEGL